MNLRLFVALILSGATISAGSSAMTTEELHRSRMDRRSLDRLGLANYDAQQLALSQTAKSTAPAFADIKVNSDNGAATYLQRNSDVAHFSDGRGAAVWEDERNGVWTIVAQPLNSSGQPVGANRVLSNGNPPASLRQPRIIANGSGLALILWVNETNGGLYGRAYDFSLNATAPEFRIDDAVAGNLISFPAGCMIASNRFVVVWEDSRSGANIYAQILNADASKAGSNFPINAAVAASYRIAPQVASDLDGDFAVVWEDGRTGTSDVYYRMFTDVGTPLFPELQIDAANAADYQFMPTIEFLRGNAYCVSFISNRSGGQSAYGQLVSTSSALIGTTFRVNDADTDVCWDLASCATADSGIVIVWVEYSTSAAVQGQKLSKTGALSGGNFHFEDNGLLRERSYPSVAQNSTGFTGIWVDDRNYNLDIYAQRLTTALAKSGVNFKLNDDATGAQQLTPALAELTGTGVVTAWHDRRNDQGDIYLQGVSAVGGMSGAQTRVNDDHGHAIQRNPSLDFSNNGIGWVAWEDTRGNNQKIYAQRYNGSFAAQGANIVVNDDATAAPKSMPSVDVSLDGRGLIVWCDERDGTKQIYLQKYLSSGAPNEGNVKVSSVSSTQNFAPQVDQRADLSFVVAWMAVAGSKQTVFFQRFLSNGSVSGAAQMLNIDTTLAQATDFDLFVHDISGNIYLAAIELQSGQKQVKLYGYTAQAAPLFSGVVVSDQPGDYKDIALAGDVSDAMIITWSATTSGATRGRLQLMRSDGIALGSNQMITSSAANRQEATPVAAMIGGFYYCAWADSRNAGAGYDIYLNSFQYTSTDADDDGGEILPREFALEQNFPNPFNPETMISFSIQKPATVTLTVFNALGQRVTTLVDQALPAGRYDAAWDARNAPSGVYFYRLTVDAAAITKKMALVR